MPPPNDTWPTHRLTQQGLNTHPRTHLKPSPHMMEMPNKMVAPILTTQQNTPLQPKYCHLYAHTSHDYLSHMAFLAYDTFLV